MIRVVCDTNLLISGLLFGGIPGQIYDAGVQGKFVFLRSLDLSDELRRVLSYSKFDKRFAQAGLYVDELVYNFVNISVTVSPVFVPIKIVRDPKDVIVLAAAVGGKADYIVTGDEDLLTIGEYAGVRIVTPAHFLEILMRNDS